MNFNITVIGAGLAGCEAAWAAANRGLKVQLLEMKPAQKTPAHKSNLFAELVCSNSLKALRLASAAGLLKAEMRPLLNGGRNLYRTGRRRAGGRTQRLFGLYYPKN